MNSMEKIEEFAAQVIGVHPSARPPQAVGPNFGDVVNHATTADGSIVLRSFARSRLLAQAAFL